MKPLDLSAPAKLWLGPDFDAEGESLGKPRDIRSFKTAAEAVRACMELGPRKYGASIETLDGHYGMSEIEAAYARLQSL